MLSEKNIVVTIGNYGAIVALHSGGKIEDHVFLDDFNEESRTQISKICLANKRHPIYVLLDTIDQSYKKKIYPSVKKSDLAKIVKRDLANDGDTTLLKGYMIMNSKKPSIKKTKQGTSDRWECLFISSSDSDLINKWLEYLLEMPNNLVGIYMSPVETFGLFQMMQASIKSHSKTKNKNNDLYCVVLQNQVSGIRQIVFSSQGIVFTRIVNYDFNQADFLEKYERDLYSTFEYLKRIFPNLMMSELDIVNIFPEKALSLIGNISNPELNLINYTPNQASIAIGYPSLLDSDSSFCDFLVSKAFSKGKKILKFTTPKINILERFFLTIRYSYYLNLVLIALIIGTGVANLFSRDKVAQSIEAAETIRYKASEELSLLKKLVFEGSKINDENKIVLAERVIDFGKVDEVLNQKKGLTESYTKMNFLRNFDVKLTSFSFSAVNFNNTYPSQNLSYKITFAGNMINRTGDIEDLFRQFDYLTAEIKKNFPSTNLKYEELPRSLDFGTKYYEYPVNFTIVDGVTAAVNEALPVEAK
ncbi:MAG: hypothetical protein KGP29_00630 [Proteobacteria bacterium]|nr:hypothetical protein [Pseudomonadota bacterium]